MIYLAVDPGKISGIAIYDPHDMTVPETHVSGPIGTCRIIHDTIENLVQSYEAQYNDFILVVERYTMGTTVRSSQPDALEIIGALKWIAQEVGVPLYLQGASEAAKIGSRSNLTRLGWWIKSDKDQHQNKALGHIAVAIQRNNPAEWLRMLGEDTNSMV